MTRRFWTVTVHVTGRPREVDVLLYDTLRDLRSAATRYVNRWEKPSPGKFAHTLALVHAARRYRVLDDGSEQEHPGVAIIRFSRQELTPLIVAHEVMHATAAIYGFDMLKADDLAEDHFDSGNEPLAELYGELFGAVWGVVREAVSP